MQMGGKQSRKEVFYSASKCKPGGDFWTVCILLALKIWSNRLNNRQNVHNKGCGLFGGSVYPKHLRQKIHPLGPMVYVLELEKDDL